MKQVSFLKTSPPLIHCCVQDAEYRSVSIADAQRKGGNPQ